MESLAPAFGSVAPPLGSVGFVALGSDAFGSVGFDALGSVPAVFVEEGSVLEPVSKGGEVVSDICVESRQKRRNKAEKSPCVSGARKPLNEGKRLDDRPTVRAKSKERKESPYVNEEYERLALERREGSTVEPVLPASTPER